MKVAAVSSFAILTCIVTMGCARAPQAAAGPRALPGVWMVHIDDETRAAVRTNPRVLQKMQDMDQARFEIYSDGKTYLRTRDGQVESGLKWNKSVLGRDRYEVDSTSLLALSGPPLYQFELHSNTAADCWIQVDSPESSQPRIEVKVEKIF